LASNGGAGTIWAKKVGNARTAVWGLIAIEKEAAMTYAESEQLDPEEKLSAGFDLADA
jgi:hypothetical protein